MDEKVPNSLVVFPPPPGDPSRPLSQRWRPPGPRRSDSCSRSPSPAFASELHIQPLASPLYNHLGCCDELLSEHFRAPRSAHVVADQDVCRTPR